MDALWKLIGRTGQGVVVALKPDGRPHLSNVDYVADETSARIRFSTTEDRVKVRLLRHDPRASFYVTTADGSAYAVAEGTAELSPTARHRTDETVEELIDVYRGVKGEHPDWDDYRRAMVADRRLVVRIHVARVYGRAPQR
jgi:PPOX class probable F420-dependent enzyme